MAQKPEVDVWVDGACRRNPGGPGGIGVVLLCGSHRKELSVGYVRTTSNRMELRAVLHALEALREPCHIQLFSDSRYIVDAWAEGRIARWQSFGWRRRPKCKDMLRNADLWRNVWVVQTPHTIEAHWVRGHHGIVENERCDKLANLAIDSGVLREDVGMDAIESSRIGNDLVLRSA